MSHGRLIFKPFSPTLWILPYCLAIITEKDFNSLSSFSKDAPIVWRPDDSSFDQKVGIVSTISNALRSTTIIASQSFLNV